MTEAEEARVREIVQEEFDRRESAAMVELIKVINARADEKGQM